MASTDIPECDKYDALEIIGRGSFGTIRKVRRKSDGKIMCRKEINYHKMSQREREQLHAEFSILSSLRHDNIVAYYFRDHLKATQELHIYMEFCGGGDLGKNIRENRAKGVNAPEGFVWDVLAQLTMALYRCHYGEDPPAVGSDVLAPPPSPKKLRSKTQMMILHRDLKPDNIFLGEDDSVKLGDFGLSKAMASHDLASTYVGTPYYMSPEICAAERYGWHSDVWAMGCILYELCQGRPPFDARTHFHLVQKIKDGRFDPLPSMYSEDLRNVIASCLQVNPAKRPTTKDIVNLPIVRLVRGQRETLKLGRTLKAKENLMAQKVAEAEALLAKSNAEKVQEAQELKSKLSGQIREEVRSEVEAEVGNRLRREWEVKARLEIDKYTSAEENRLQGIFESEVEKRVKLEVTKHVESLRNSSKGSSDSSQKVPMSSIATADTPPTDISVHLSSMTFESPLPSINAPAERKSTRTPFARAQTQIDSPMDVQMVSPSPMSVCASLSLSPRRAEASKNGRNLFAVNAAGAGARDIWQPQTVSGINSETEDEEDELPELPSPTRPPRNTTVAGAKDPFKTAVPAGRPALRRQNTLPANVVAQQPTLFPGNTGKHNETSKMHSPTSPTRRPYQRPLQKAITTANINGEDMMKAVTQKNMLAVHPASNNAVSAAPTSMVTSTTGGRTLIDLNNNMKVVAATPALNSAPAFPEPHSKPVTRAFDMEERPAAVWDPDKDDMPSPFLARKRPVGLGVR